MSINLNENKNTFTKENENKYIFSTTNSFIFITLFFYYITYLYFIYKEPNKVCNFGSPPVTRLYLEELSDRKWRSSNPTLTIILSILLFPFLFTTFLFGFFIRTFKLQFWLFPLLIIVCCGINVKLAMNYNENSDEINGVNEILNILNIVFSCLLVPIIMGVYIVYSMNLENKYRTRHKIGYSKSLLKESYMPKYYTQLFINFIAFFLIIVACILSILMIIPGI